MREQDKPLGSGDQAVRSSETVPPTPARSPAAQPQNPAGTGDRDTSWTNRVSHSYGGEGGRGGAEGEGPGKDRIKILRIGVDGLVLSFEGDIAQDLDFDLMECKRLAQSPYKDEQARAQWPIKDHIFEVSHRGQKPFAYILEDNSFRICVSSAGSRYVPLAYAKISSELLAHKGPEAAVEELIGIVSELGDASRFPIVSRVDPFVDFQTSVDIESFSRKDWITRAGGIDTYSRKGQFTGWKMGAGGDISARLYNKLLEIVQKSGKAYFIELWRRAGMDRERPVWRLEFQVMRKVLEELGIRSFEGLMRNMGGIWGYATQTWLRLAIPDAGDSNRARWSAHPLWQQLAAIVWRLDDVPLKRTFSAARVPSEEKLVRLFMSVLTSFMGKNKILDYQEGLQRFLERSDTFHHTRCEENLEIDFAEWVRQEVGAKTRRFNTLINVPSPAKDASTSDEVDRNAIAYNKASRGE